MSSKKSKTRQLVLELDRLDWETVQTYIADYQAASAKVRAMSGGKGGAIVPDGNSNLAGAIMAECVRDLFEYRAMWAAADNDNQDREGD